MTEAPITCRSSRTVHWLVLAHHRPAQANRCVHLPLGARDLALCARCLGLYPFWALTLGIQALAGIEPLGAWDHAITLPGACVGLLDWGSGLLDPGSGSNGRRIITGALTGISLGRSFWLYLGDLYSEVFWVQILLLIFGVLAFVLVRYLSPDRDPSS